MSYSFIEILGYAIGLAAIAGLLKIQKIETFYYPFIILLWAGLANEIVNSIIINASGSNAINSNIFVLFESLLLLWFFLALRLFGTSSYLFYLFLFLFILVWSIENFVLSDIGHFNSYFRILYSFIVVLMSIHQINQLHQQEKRKLIKNPVFLIMIGFIAFFTYKVLVEIFWVYGLNASRDFRVKVYRIMTYINLAVNIIFLIAVLWMPRKRDYTLL